MNGREQIRSAVPLSAPRRADQTERAAAMIAGTEPTPPGPGTCKLTTRVRADQLEWLKEQARTYHRRHSRAPKLTIEELVRLAIDQLRETPHLDDLVTRYRGG